jgi:hypothetical protein
LEIIPLHALRHPLKFALVVSHLAACAAQSLPGWTFQAFILFAGFYFSGARGSLCEPRDNWPGPWMYRFKSWIYFCSIAITAIWAATAWSENNPAGMTRSPSSENYVNLSVFEVNFNGEAPSDIISIDPKLVAIFDHVGGKVIFTDDAGTFRGAARIPSGFRVGAVRNFPDRTVLIDEGRKTKITLPRSASESTEIPHISEAAVSLDDPDITAPTLVNRLQRRKSIRPQPGAGFDAELELFSLTPERLVSATFLGVDAQGNGYSLSREMEIVESDDDASYRKIKVTLTVGQHDRTGRRIKVAVIPLDKLFKTPFGHYVTVDPTGQVIALLPIKNKGIVLFKPVLVAEVSQHKSPNPLAAAAQTNSAAISALQSASESEIPGLTTSANSAEQKDAPISGEAIPGRKKYADMKETAKNFMNFKWRVSRSENLAIGHQADCNFKRIDPLHSFELPHALKNAELGDDLTGVPYNWDGKGDLDSIRDELARGYRAGNICSEYRNKSPNTTGIDCSGFVAQVWGVSSFGTGNAKSIAKPLTKLERMRWGDVFVRVGHHIRLYVEQEVTPEFGMRIHTLESQGACNGTCERSYHVEHFHGYELMRLSSR